ncbi:5236_t:CDS:2 [Paraglomus occultum]|uniref:5236_t:CDS:1 n=1 Tax=Paraglomus occultum TaxID=144539 RepID=A0A9N8ZZ82_9GLOM|nr:5236_t:CDS:2 [Paraglomus occultum]
MSIPLTLRALHITLIVGLIGIFGFNLYAQIKDAGVITQSFSVVTNDSLVPPALTFCISESTGYTFNVTVYGETVSADAFLQTFPTDNPLVSTLKSIVSDCWILAAPGNASIIRNPPPTPNVPEFLLTYSRDLSYEPRNVTTLFLNIFDPLQRSSLFDFNRFLLVDTDKNRAVIFTRIQSFNIYGEVTNDVQYQIIEEFRDPTWTVPGVSAKSQIRIRPASFDIHQTTSVRNTTVWTIIRDSFTLLGVLYGSIYVTLIGPGKFRPWGHLHNILRYYPVEHIKNKGVSGEALVRDKHVPEERGLEQRPTLDETLGVFLEKFAYSKYDRK